MAQALLHGQMLNETINLGVLKPAVIKKRIGFNLRRLRLSHGWTQDQLGAGCDPPVEGSHIAAIEGGGGLRVDMLARLCDALEVDPYEFYRSEQAPFISDEKEQSALQLFRKADALGVAEDIVRYGEYRVKEARHEAADRGATKKARVARHKGRAG